MPTTRATLQLVVAAALVFGADSLVVQTLQLHGISVSPSGLVALLRSEDSNSLLPLAVTADDTERATTPPGATGPPRRASASPTTPKLRTGGV